MKTIKILGTGCNKCRQTEAVVFEAINKFNLDAEVIKVEDIQDIIKYQVLSTPAIVINEEVKLKGKVPSLEEVREALM